MAQMASRVVSRRTKDMSLQRSLRKVLYRGASGKYEL